VRSFDLLLGLLDGNAIPPVAASQAWAASRHWADRLWLELTPR
jgi:hypothetical protein